MDTNREAAGRSQPEGSQPDGEGRRVGRVWDLVILVGASLFAPLMVWANSTERAHIVGFALFGLSVLLVALVLRELLIRAGLEPLGTTLAVSAFVFGFTNGGILLDRGVSRVLVAVGVGALAVIAYLLRDLSVFSMAALWGGLFVLGYPWLVWVTTGPDPGERSIPDPEPLTAELTVEPRDIVLVVLDGYANSVVLSEMYHYDTSEFDSQLSSLGFEVSSAASASFGRTRMSVAGVMQLAHPISPGEFEAADFDHLLEIIGGDNVLAHWLEDQGYSFTYVESGWFGTRCAGPVDTCVEGPWPNESFYDVTNRSLMKDLPGLETGRSFSRGARKVLDWLTTDLERLLANDQPDLVYAHVLAPHPPLFYDSECNFRPQDGIKGFTIAQPGMSETDLERARDWYVSQMQCVNQHLLEVASTVEVHDAVAVMFGDHGPDSLGQLFVVGTQWSERQRWERFSAMLAARVPGCDMSRIESLANVGRRLVSCISDTDLPDLPIRTFESEPVPGGQRLVEVAAPDYGTTP